MKTVLFLSFISFIILVILFDKTEAAADNSNGTKNTTIELWPNGVVPYEIDPRFPEAFRIIAQLALLEIENQTCIRFEERAPLSKNKTSGLVFLFTNNSICSAVVGYRSRQLRQFITLHPSCFATFGIIMRQLMLTLGFDNEHNRSNRDEFVMINWDNIMPSAKKEFEILPQTPNNPATLLSLPYDYDSVLHYSAFAFAVNKSVPTLVPKKPLPPGVQLGQRHMLSDGDVKKINTLYKCTEAQIKANREESSGSSSSKS